MNTRIELSRNVSVVALAVAALLLTEAASAARFTANGDGTITDAMTGLMWTQGYKYGPSTGVGWSQSLSTCENLVLAGHSDWRLPNIKEAVSILDLSRSNPMLDPSFGAPSTQSMSYQYAIWTSTTVARQPDQAYLVNITSGNVDVRVKTVAQYPSIGAFCVRNP